MTLKTSTMAMIIFAGGLLAACSDVVYYAEGVTVTRRAQDMATCQRNAQQQFPVFNETRVEEGEFVPERQTCSANGTCVTEAAHYTPPEYRVVDVNEAPRRRAARLCMLERGYRMVEMRMCRGNAMNSIPERMPPLSDTVCLASADRNGYMGLIADPGR
jgi:hypothetical protein